QGLGLGNEMYGLFNYYLASPLNLILFLFPKNNIENGILLIIYLKLILGGIFFEKYLNKFNINNMFRILLPLIYVFSGYFLFNLINPIWLDISYMLPLTMISLDLLINKGIKKWFILSASLMVIINFYIGFMLCLFSFIYLMYEYFLNKFNKDVFINYIISAVL
ncbi:YfhO family protein, partial [Sutterella wadsworthensis]|uniref:YfhO family protein n=1 Tax=Sutterella wadsworthensis TaxID=40545 RepID=UPI0032C0B4E8